MVIDVIYKDGINGISAIFSKVEQYEIVDGILIFKDEYKETKIIPLINNVKRITIKE